MGSESKEPTCRCGRPIIGGVCGIGCQTWNRKPKEEGEAPLYAPGEAKSAAKTQARIEARRTAKERIDADPFLTTAASKGLTSEAGSKGLTDQQGTQSHVSEHGTSIARDAAIDHTKLVSGQHDSLASGPEPTLASQCACCGWGGPGKWEHCHNCTKAMRNERDSVVLYLEQRGYQELAEAIYRGEHKP